MGGRHGHRRRAGNPTVGLCQPSEGFPKYLIREGFIEKPSEG